jgi:dihydrofolate reductase
LRKVIFGINITVDGCCDHTKGTGYEDIHEYFTDLMRDADLLVYGRKTYQLMVPYWPEVAKNHSGKTKATNEFAQVFDAIDMVVFSRTLEMVEGKNRRIVRTSPQEEITRLKQEPGKNILLGGVDLPSQLVESGLVDEFHFVVQPKLAGEGRRLFDSVNLPEGLPLKLVESKILTSGCVALRYVKQ